MKRVTEDFFKNVFDSAIIEYTRNRFISEEEISDLKKNLIEAFDRKIEHEIIEDATIVLTVDAL